MPPRCAGSSSRTASAAPHARDPLRPDPATGPEPSAPCVVPRLPRVAIDRCPAPPIRRPHRISPPNVGQAAGVCLAEINFKMAKEPKKKAVVMAKEVEKPPY